MKRWQLLLAVTTGIAIGFVIVVVVGPSISDNAWLKFLVQLPGWMLTAGSGAFLVRSFQTRLFLPDNARTATLSDPARTSKSGRTFWTKGLVVATDDELVFHPGVPVGPRSWRQRAIPLGGFSGNVRVGPARPPSGRESWQLVGGFRVAELTGTENPRLLAARPEDLAWVAQQAAA